MPIDIKTAGYQKKERVAAPLDVYAGTLNTLQKKHESAIDSANKIKTFLANKNLNEAENKWLSDYSQQINNQIESAAEEGSYASALTTATKLAGEVASNPALIGRERYQQEYKKFQDEVVNNKSYDGDIKAYALAQNKYNYSDEVDESGRIVGGKQFNPNYRPVEQIDYNTLYQKVLSTVGVDAKAGESLVFGDANGNIVSNQYSKDLIPMLKKGSSVQELSADKIRAAFEAALNETPGARASLEQDYRVNVWKAGKGENNIVTRKDGMIMSQDEFKESLFADRYTSSAYKRTTNSIDASIGFNILESRRKAAETAATKSSRSSGSSSEPKNLMFDFVSTGANLKVEPDTPAKLESTINSSRSQLNALYSKYKVSSTLGDEASYGELRNNIMKDSTIDDNLRYQYLNQAENSFNSIQQAQNRLEAIRPILTKEEQQASEFLGKRYSSGELENSDNPMAKKYATYVNSIMTDDKGNVGAELAFAYDTDGSKTLYNNLRTTFGLTDNDIKIRTNSSGKEYVHIKKNAFEKLAPEILSALEEKEVFVMGTEGMLKSDKASKLYGYSQNDRLPTFNRMAAGYTPRYTAKDNTLAGLMREVNSLSAEATNRINKTIDPTYKPLKVFHLPMEATVNGELIDKSTYENYTNGVLNSLALANGGNIQMRVVNENGVLEEVDDSRIRSSEMDKIRTAIGKNNYNIGYGINHNTGKAGVYIGIGYTPKTGKNTSKNPNADSEGRSPHAYAMTYFLEGAVLNDAIRKLEQNPEIQTEITLSNIEHNSALKSKYRLSDSEFGDGSYHAEMRTELGNIVYDIRDDNGNGFTTSADNIRNIINNNKANKAQLASTKFNIEKIQARNGSIAASPVEEQLAVVYPLINKALIDNGYASISDVSQIPKEERSKVLRHFYNMYKNTTGENPSDVILNQMTSLMNE